MSAPASSAGIREQLREALACLAGDGDGEALYAAWYAKPRHASTPPAGCPPRLGELLRAAHAGFRAWRGGWRVEQVGRRGQVTVRDGGEARLLERCDYVATGRAGLLPRPGDEVIATERRDRLDAEEGWWRTAGPAWSWAAPPPGLVRLYFNRPVSGLPALVGRLTGMLAGEPVPWMLKCATDPAVYARRDAVVAFLARDVVERRWAEIVDAPGDEDARPGAPPLTLQVAPGVGAAFDPGGGESFGSHRCRLVAGAAGGTVDDALRRLAEGGIDPDRPWARRDDGLLPWER